MIRKRRTKSASPPSVYRIVPAIALRMVGGDLLSLIEYLWKQVSLIRGRSTKGESFPLIYQGSVSDLAPKGRRLFAVSH